MAKRVIPPGRPVIIVGSHLTDGKSFWRIERFDDDFVSVSQPGTVTAPFSWETIARLTVARDVPRETKNST